MWELEDSPVTDGDQKIFGCGGEQLKVGDVQLLHLHGFTELNDEPEREAGNQNSPIRILIHHISTHGEKTGTYQILLLQGLSMYMSMFSIRMAEVLCRDSVQHESLFHHPARSPAAWIICWNVLYLCFWVRTKDLGSTLHRSIVVEVLLDLLPSV